jgi:hypothetical protein
MEEMRVTFSWVDTEEPFEMDETYHQHFRDWERRVFETAVSHWLKSELNEEKVQVVF